MEVPLLPCDDAEIGRKLCQNTRGNGLKTGKKREFLTG
jgi:hypothetical protein